ncbi:LysR family transcriptional regulator, partial [Pseudomonas aeruginosa]|nr:LysR family transcriptional regulator [Pseudomonas aeruginosa]
MSNRSGRRIRPRSARSKSARSAKGNSASTRRWASTGEGAGRLGRGGFGGAGEQRGERQECEQTAHRMLRFIVVGFGWHYAEGHANNSNAFQSHIRCGVRMSDLRQFRHFVALAEHGHFARAAEAVNLS